MVRSFYAAVDRAGEWLPFFRAEDMVDAHVHGIAVERAPNAVGSGAIGVGHAATKEMVGIRNGRVVEVAAHDERFALLPHAVDKGYHRVGLLGALHGGFRQF